MIRSILEDVRFPQRCTVLDSDLDLAEHFAEVARCRAFVGHKTHSVLIALTVGTPVLALAYHPKTADFMKQYDL